MAISDTKLRSAKPADKPYKITDSGGLYLVVSPSGAKLWRWKYRVLGREKTLSLGQYPEISLKDARSKREEASEQLANQQDPGAEKKKAAVAQAVQANNTFKLVAEEYLANKAADRDAEATQTKAAWLLKQLEPSLGSRPISEIQAFEVLDALRKMERRGRLETAHRLRSFASRVFRYAIWTTRAETDPASLLAGALKSARTKHHAAIIEPEPLGDLLRSISSSIRTAACNAPCATKAPIWKAPHQPNWWPCRRVPTTFCVALGPAGRSSSKPGAIRRWGIQCAGRRLVSPL